MRWTLAALAVLGASGCLKAWDVAGPFACADDGTCAAGLTCDDGVCCLPGGSPACPTMAVAGACASGATPATYYRDLDGDGFGDPANGRPFCGQPRKEAWVADATDCDDHDDTVNPRATERCNGVDDNCNGDIDEGTPRTTFYVDSDSDGFGEDCPTCTLLACARPKGYAARGGDCDGGDPQVYPGAPERCNNLDDNCNGQKDDPPFLDVESPGFDGGLFPCFTGQPGACSAGGLQCVFSPASGQDETVCVPRAVPTTDVCGDGLDQDCSGTADDAPGCGGPSSLVSLPGARSAAMRLDLADTTATSKLPPRCLRDEPGAEAMGWLSPSWIGNDAMKNVWFVEAPAGRFWDLSQPGATLHLEFEHGEVGGFSPPLPAHTPPAFGDGGTYFRSPVVTLCGASKTAYRRWTPDPQVILDGRSPYSVNVPVAGTPPQWTLETGGGAFSLSHVEALEVLVEPFTGPSSAPVSFRITFTPDAGFY